MHSFLLYIVPSVPFTVTVFPSASRIVPSQERLLTVLSPVTIQLADAVPDDIALHFLIVRAKEAVRTVCSGLSPASFVVISGAAQEECIVIRVVNVHIGKYKSGFYIGRIEHSAIFCSQCSAAISKVLFPASESPDMLWYKITFQVQSFCSSSLMFPVRSVSNRRSEFKPSMQTASEPLWYHLRLPLLPRPAFHSVLLIRKLPPLWTIPPLSLYSWFHSLQALTCLQRLLLRLQYIFVSYPIILSVFF